MLKYIYSKLIKNNKIFMCSSLECATSISQSITDTISDPKSTLDSISKTGWSAVKGIASFGYSVIKGSVAMYRIAKDPNGFIKESLKKRITPLSWKTIQDSPSSPFTLQKKGEIFDAFIKRALPSWMLFFDGCIEKAKRKILEDRPAKPGKQDKVKEIVDKHLSPEILHTVLQQLFISLHDVMKASFLLHNEPSDEELETRILKFLGKDASFSDYTKHVTGLMKEGIDKFIDAECPELNKVEKLILKSFITEHIFGALQEVIIATLSEQIDKMPLDGMSLVEKNLIKKELKAAVNVASCMVMENLVTTLSQGESGAHRQLDKAFIQLGKQVESHVGLFNNTSIPNSLVKKVIRTACSSIQPSKIITPEVCDHIKQVFAR